jgi:hypothetical protein
MKEIENYLEVKFVMFTRKASIVMRTILITAIILSVGCSHTQVQSNMRFINSSPTDLKDISEARNNLANYHKNKLGKEFRDEWKFNRNQNEPPVLGLALSGGGVRSASFSIGVLKALHKQGILQNVDVISSVSGGSYALYWYYMQHLYMDNNCSEAGKEAGKIEHTVCGYPSIFETSLVKPTEKLEHRFQTHLEKSSDLLIIGRPPKLLRKPYIGVAELGKYISTIPFQPLNGIANGLFDWDMNLFPFRRYYQNAIGRTYGLSPSDEKAENYVNDKSFGPIPNAQTEEVYFTDIANFIEKNDLPFFVINATAGHDRIGTVFYKDLNKYIDQTKKNSISANKIFEFTPLGYGSEVFGYSTFKENKALEEEIHFSKAVAISGAAVDYQAFSGLGKGAIVASLLRSLNLNLGYSIDNYNIDKNTVIANNLLPFPLYMAHNYHLANPSRTTNIDGKNFQFPSKHSTKIRLSDGGQSENLGILSLIKRGVKHIVAVDAENDICKNDPSKICFGSLKKLNQTLEDEYGLKIQWNGDPEIVPISFQHASQSVFRGTITEIEPNTNNSFKIALTYIKLAYDKNNPCDESVLPNNNCSIKQWVDKKKENNPWEDYEDFPQVSTVDVFYEPSQVRAYRDLGYQIACSKNFKDGYEDGNSNLPSPNRPIQQPCKTN